MADSTRTRSGQSGSAKQANGRSKGPSNGAGEAEIGVPDPAAMGEAVSDIAAKSQKLVTDFLSRQGDSPHSGSLDPLNIGTAFMQMTAKMMSDPTRMIEAQMDFWNDYVELWRHTTQKMMGIETDPVHAPESGDRRFKDAAWDDSMLFDYVKQSYLLSARWIQRTVNDVEGLDPKTAQKIDFYTRQFVDAMAPSNFVMTNPEVLRATLESGGENLVSGLQNLLEDLERGQGKLSIKMTDAEAFQVGENIAVTPGKVIYQNELMQLLQYSPTTEQVYSRPLLIIPPWINKFYILDLRPKNSFIKWCVEQGLTVFVISWVNPDEKLAEKTFDDYMVEGPLDALDQIEKATGQKDANVIGYCLGGTLLACTLSYMKKKGDKRFKSATFFTTMTDFYDAGELSVFIDDEQLHALEAKMNERGYLDGADMATTFNMLRANDLIWSFVVNNYLLGKDPFPFDLLYWNSDSTRMPAAMHSFYLRKMYQENKLSEPGGITVGGEEIDLGDVDIPSFMLSTREDHIAPWKSTYAATQLFSGPVRFCLSGSGHIAGVINPPEANKYGYWLNDETPKRSDLWLRGATQHEGSWWPEWKKWIARQSGRKVKARVPGEGKLKAIEDAPGSYVKVKSQEPEATE